MDEIETDSSEISRTMFTDGKKIMAVSILISGKSDALGELCRYIEKYNIEVLYLNYYRNKGKYRKNSEGKIVSFLDFTRAKVSPGVFINEIRRRNYVRAINEIKPLMKGLVCDTSFPLTIFGRRAIILRREVYEGLLTGIREQFGSLGEQMLYYEGFRAGFAGYDMYMELAKGEKLRLPEILQVMAVILGWGTIREIKIDYERKRAFVSGQNSFECELGYGSPTPYSQFIRGVLAGVFTRFFEVGMEAKEVKCVAKGDPYCEFVISPME